MTAVRVGVVVIGRNEGDRLARCLDSVLNKDAAVVYVDSESGDGSAERARRRGAHVVELSSAAAPLSAARSRNAGLAALVEIEPGAEFVQFVDGDTVLDDGWMKRGEEFLAAHPSCAVVFGHLREAHPERSVYNRLCNMEWRKPPGAARACGGVAMMRVEAVRGVGGFDASLIAGEEPELCVRLRGAGWTVHCLDAPMGAHDAEMVRFGQWWKRSVRGGFAYAEGYWMHGGRPERHNARQLRSVLLWGAVIPLVAVAAAPFTGGWSLVSLALYAVLYWRVRRSKVSAGWPARDASIYARFVVLAKAPQFIGCLQFAWSRAIGRRRSLIEYKHGPAYVGGTGSS